MPRCWREVLFLFMQHEYKIREGGRNFPQKGMVPWHAEENSRAGTACKWGGKRRIKEIEITVFKYFLKKQDDCSPLNPKTQGEKYRAKHLFSLCLLYCSLRRANPFLPPCPQLLFHPIVLSSWHTYDLCPPSLQTEARWGRWFCHLELIYSSLRCAVLLCWGGTFSDVGMTGERKTKQQSMCGGWPSHPITTYLCSFF